MVDFSAKSRRRTIGLRPWLLAGGAVCVVTVVGLLAGRLWSYRGSGSAGSRAAVSSPAIDDCDTYAAHPSDVNRWAVGVADDQVVPGLAVYACTAAVDGSSGTARFHFQLGRALLAADRAADALAAFKQADTLGYCPAKYYLGEAALQTYFDSGSDADFQRAVTLYEAGDQCGFEPAGTRLAELNFSEDGFEAPKVVRALYDGDIATLNKARFTVAMYLQGIHEFMSMDLHPVDQACPANVARAAVIYDLDAAAAGDSRFGAVGTEVGAFGVKLLGPVGSIVDPVFFASFDRYKSYFRGIGKRDAQHLVNIYGCSSLVTEQLYGGLLEFAKTKQEIGDYWHTLMPGTREFFGEFGVSTPAVTSSAAPSPTPTP